MCTKKFSLRGLGAHPGSPNTLPAWGPRSEILYPVEGSLPSATAWVHLVCRKSLVSGSGGHVFVTWSFGVSLQAARRQTKHIETIQLQLVHPALYDRLRESPSATSL